MARRWTPGPMTGGIENECGDGDAQNLVKERLGKKPKEHRNVEHTTVKETTRKKAQTKGKGRWGWKRTTGKVERERDGMARATHEKISWKDRGEGDVSETNRPRRTQTDHHENLASG